MLPGPAVTAGAAVSSRLSASASWPPPCWPYLAYLTKQPLLLAYIAAGAAIGPQFGFGWVHDKDDVRIIAHIGLILLLFMIGLELDLKKLKESGKSLITAGLLQFILCTAMGLGFFTLLGFTIGEPYEYRIFGVKVLGSEYDLLYLAVCMALSSTTIVVKLLYEKFELDTLAGRLTLGVLVFQDIWAIVVLSFQSIPEQPPDPGALARLRRGRPAHRHQPGRSANTSWGISSARSPSCPNSCWWPPWGGASSSAAWPIFLTCPWKWVP